MSRILKYIAVGFLLFFVYAQNASASIFDSFTKYEFNPLTVSKNYEGWNEVTPIQHYILKEGSSYSMWYTTYNLAQLKIAYADSLNGLTWQSGRLIQIADPGDIHDPAVIKQGGRTYLYYVSDFAGTSTFKRAETQDNVNFGQPQNISLPRQSWNSRELSCPYVYYKNGVYFLLYCGHDGNRWSLGMATSTDGLTFTPCANNPTLPHLGNSYLVEEVGKFHLYAHSTTAEGVKHMESSDELSCSSVWSQPMTIIPKDRPYDSGHILGPTLVQEDGELRLYYSGRNASGIWTLNLARAENPKPKEVYVILPGFFGSWSQEAILHGEDVPYSSWKIPDYIREYTGLLETLRNIGLAENRDFFVFPYDWRKNPEALADNLNDFIVNNVMPVNENLRINLIGHSYGGLVARIYAQKYGIGMIGKVVTVGTPHKGVLQVYKAVEAGELERNDNLLWLGSKIYLAVAGKLGKSDKQIIESELPSLRSLFPIFNFLKTIRGSVVDINTLNIKNEVLSRYDQMFDLIQDKVVSIYGEKDDRTLIQYQIKSPSFFDVLLGRFLDGVPVKDFFSKGDYLVPKASANVGSDPVMLPLDHTELITKRAGIKSALSAVGLSVDDSQIVEGEKTVISPSIIVTIQSPAEIAVLHNGVVHDDEDGLIYISGARSGDYEILVKGLSNGVYTLTVGQIGSGSDVWEKVTGKIDAPDPLTQIDSYKLKFNTKDVKKQLNEYQKCSKPRHIARWKDFKKYLKCKLKKIGRS